MKKYTRQETIELCAITSSRLSYFDRLGLVVPEKVGTTKKPYVFYTEEQIYTLCSLNLLAQWFQLEALYAFVEDEKVREAMLNFLNAIQGEPGDTITPAYTPAADT